MWYSLSFEIMLPSVFLLKYSLGIWGLTKIFFFVIFSQRSYITCVKWRLLLLMLNFCLDLYQMRQSTLSLSLSSFLYLFTSCRVTEFSFSFLDSMKKKFHNKICSENRCNAPCSSWDEAPSFISWLASYQAPYFGYFETDPSTVSSTWICEY